jgi:hypothetical protein
MERSVNKIFMISQIHSQQNKDWQREFRKVENACKHKLCVWKRLNKPVGMTYCKL